MTPNDQRSTPGSNPQNTSSNHVDPYKWQAFLAGAMVAITPIIMIGAVVAATPSSTQPAVQFSTASAMGGAPVKILSAETLYKNTCMVCHGDDGQGVPRLGKPLRNSAFVQESSDEALFGLIAQGRMPDDPLNTTGSLMPPRGAQNISDEAIHKVVVLLRGMQDTSMPTASTDAWNIEQPATQVVVDASVLNHPNRDLFVSSCSACHGANGEGIEGLGKSFVTSEFVASSTDKELMTMIKMGRPIWDAANTTGVDMPPKGGNPAITDDQLNGIISYIRSIASVPAETVVDASILGHPGRDLFISSCSACHGADGQGIEGLGKSFVTSEFVASSTDKELMTMIKMGRPIWDAANTTGVDMPPKGGNPAITDDQLNEIISYIRSVSKVND